MGPDCEQASSVPTGSLRKQLMVGIATDPAARGGILLSAIAAICLYRNESLQRVPLLGLRGYVIRCIQAALDNPNTRHSDNTTLAIGALGISELVFGCHEAYETHMGGVTCIKDVRGRSMPWVLSGILSWMATLQLPQITRGTRSILGQSTTET